MSTIKEKQTFEGNTTYLIVELDSGVECALMLYEDDIVSPSVAKTSNHEDLRKACEIAEEQGYTVNLNYGTVPKGFEY